MKFVNLEEARNAPGVRLVVLAAIPSPWSEAAKGLFVIKGIDGMLVRLGPRDEAVKQWTAHHNAPVLFVDREPPRAHWSDILEAAERLGGTPLLPADPGERGQVFALGHELLGESGLVWSGRIIAIHRGLTTDGREGFPPRIAQYLAPKYGYAADRVAAAKARVLALLRRFGEMVDKSRSEGRDYLLPSGLSALDVFLSTALAPFAMLPDDECPGVNEAVRRAFETGDPEIIAAVPQSLRAYRDHVYAQHLGLPVKL